MLRSRALTALSGAAALTGLTLLTAPAQAAAPSYVALGDSYSSGTGTRTYISDGTQCQRSVYAYPSLISSAKGYSLTFRACSGARIPDVTGTQLSALTSTTAYVSISVGGNDAGFADVLTTCAQPAWMSNCNGAIDKAQAYINGTLPAALRSLYADIRARAPQAKVAVVGYPRIFNGEDCNALTWFSPTEEARLNSTADLLNGVTASAAASAGFGFSNPAPAFVGHAVCDRPEWLNGLSSPISESYHPNVAGHSSGYTPTVSPALTGAATTVTATTLALAEASTAELAADQSRYAAVDASIRPKDFRAPNLHSPAARAAAARAGVNVNDRASVDRADAVWQARQDAAWRAGKR
ncbi:MAG: SGNH/GDSL hydrolase family protein [Micrococcales bacterium]|nr:SGNH/GDSL hydrolase family protein [Micrococcales bacterium]